LLTWTDVETSPKPVSLSDKLETVQLIEREVKQCAGDGPPDEVTETTSFVASVSKNTDTTLDSVTDSTDIQQKDPSTALDRLTGDEKVSWFLYVTLCVFLDDSG